MNGRKTSCARVFLVWGTLALTAVGGCWAGGSDALPASDPGTAAVSFALPNGRRIDTVRYVVLSSNQDVLISGAENVSDPDATLSLTLSLPVGRDDTLGLMATTATGISCSGTSVPFDVQAGGPTFVSLVLDCGGVVAEPDSCPLIALAAPNPAEAIAPAGTISVGATASDPDPQDVLSFAWAASAGTFDDATAPSTRYVCATAGAETLILTVDDHHLPSSCTMTFLLPVTCLPKGDAGS